MNVFIKQSICKKIDNLIPYTLSQVKLGNLRIEHLNHSFLV